MEQENLVEVVASLVEVVEVVAWGDLAVQAGEAVWVEMAAATVAVARTAASWVMVEVMVAKRVAGEGAVARMAAEVGSVASVVAAGCQVSRRRWPPGRT